MRPVPGSRLVDVTYSDPAPARAQRIANAYADAFIASNIDKRFEANSYAKTFLEDQSQQLKLRLEESEKALLDFAEKEQIVVVNEKSSIAENNLAAANAALGGLISERIKNEQLWRQVETATAIDLPQLLTNSVIVGLRAQAQRAGHRIPGEARDVQAGLSGHGRDQQQDRRDRPPAGGRGEDHQGLAEGRLRGFDAARGGDARSRSRRCGRKCSICRSAASSTTS